MKTATEILRMIDETKGISCTGQGCMVVKIFTLEQAQEIKEFIIKSSCSCRRRDLPKERESKTGESLATE